MSDLKAHLARIGRRWYLLAVLGVLAALVAVPAQDTSYTSTSSLITVSANRSPDQDGILARGYVDLIGEPSYQQRLRQQAQIPANVTITARTAAASPIIYVSATSTDGTIAEQAAARAAQRFMSDVNSSLKASRDRSISELRSSFAQGAPSGQLHDSALLQLQDRINALNADTTNQLQVLQLQGGVTAATPPVALIALVAGLGGMIVGAGIALVLGFLSRRLTSVYDMREKASIDPLVVIPPRGEVGGAAGRQSAFQHLAATVALASTATPTVVALTTVGVNTSQDEIGTALARCRAEQGTRTILVHTGVTRPLDNSGHGPGQPLVDGWFVLLGDVGQPFREVYPAARDQQHALLGMERLRALVDTVVGICDLLVIQAPSAGSPGALTTCAIADRALLIVQEGTQAEKLVAARNGLEESGALLLGVAFVRTSVRRHWLRRKGGRAGGGPMWSPGHSASPPAGDTAALSLPWPDLVDAPKRRTSNDQLRQRVRG
jgi:hypothetical protein